jgi:hypothetical protein
MRREPRGTGGGKTLLAAYPIPEVAIAAALLGPMGSPAALGGCTNGRIS